MRTQRHVSACINRYAEVNFGTGGNELECYLATSEAGDFLRESTQIFAIKNSTGGIIASDKLTLYVTTRHYEESVYREVLPPECIHSEGRYLLRVELPLPIDKEARIASVRTYLDGKLLHAGPYGQEYWQLAELAPGTHDFEIRIVDELFRQVLKGFRRSLSVREAPPVGASPGLCDFDNDPEDTLYLRAAGSPSHEAVHMAVSPDSSTIELASPIEGDCVCKGIPVHLSVHFPSSVSSGREQLLLVTVDGSAAMVPLNDMMLPGCFEIDPDLILNPRQYLSAEHILKVSVVTSDWTLLAESLPVMLVESNAHTTCTNRTFRRPDVGCVRVTVPQEPSAELVERIQRSPTKPKCGLNHRIDGVWSDGRYIPFFCRIPELSIPAAQACIQNRSIVFSGNSVVRGFFFGLLERLGAQTGVDSKLPVMRQLSSQGNVVESNWWRRRAETSICPKWPGFGLGFRVSGSCRSGCWSCMHTVGEGRVAYVWTRATLSGMFESITR